LLAASGGADSTALQYVISALRAEDMFALEPVCAHINHQLRGAESDADEDFVVEQAKELGFAVTTKRVDVRRYCSESKLSIETAARKLRIESLLEIAGAGSLKRVATGHHMDDNAETVVQRLARGTGFRGLGGIWPIRSFMGGVEFVRPLLCVRRDEILGYLKQRGLKFRQDSTNADCSYRRNFIRHKLLPALQSQSSDSIAERLFELSRSAQRFYELVRARVDDIWPELAECGPDRVVVDLKGFSVEHPAVKVELIRRSLAYLGSPERDLARGHFEKMLQFAEAKVSGRKIELPKGFSVVYEYGKMVLAGAAPGAGRGGELAGSFTVNVPGKTKFGSYLVESAILDTNEREQSLYKKTKTNFVEYFDMDRLTLPLEVRFHRAGERFVPLGSTREKKLGKFLTAQRVSRKLRQELLIVADSEKIIWVCPVRMSEQAKITDQTRNILRLRITDACGQEKNA